MPRLLACARSHVAAPDAPHEPAHLHARCGTPPAKHVPAWHAEASLAHRPHPAPPALAPPRRAGVQGLTELHVSLHRVARFLHTPEAPPVTTAPPPVTTTATPPNTPLPPAVAHPDQSTALVAQTPADDARAALQPGTLVLSGAHYSWNQPFGGDDDGAAAAAAAAARPAPAGGEGDKAGGEGGGARAFTLSGVRLTLRPGGLLGVCGEVGERWLFVPTSPAVYIVGAANKAQ